MWKLVALAVTAALMLAFQSKLAAIAFFAVVLGIFLSTVFRSTDASAGRL